MLTHMEGSAIAHHGHDLPQKRRRSLRNLFKLRTHTKATLGMGLLSMILYYGLYTFNADIRHIAEMTNQGDKTYFLLPIAIAFLFSVVHGIFTDKFWEALGLRAKR
ncbi:hypothetical protein [Magnetovibrio blakemorei]|nr:hypothetical protein [Magnetovibrio blakemorei]